MRRFDWTMRRPGAPEVWEWLNALAVPLVGLLLIVVVIVAGGGSPGAVLGALVQGSCSSTYARAETLVRMCPLLFTGLGVGLAFRCGVWNIGAEGQFYMGGLAVTAVAPALRGWPAILAIPAGLATGFIAGGVWGWIAAALRTRRNVQEVISTIMLNFLAIQLTSWAVHGPLGESTHQFPYSNPVPASVRLPLLLFPTRLHLGVIIAFLTAAAVWVLLFRTVAGFHLRTVGSSAAAAEHAGIFPERTIWWTMFVSGGLAGLGGAVELMGVTHILFEDFSPGYGYTAIAVALLGALHPLGITLAALLFGALQAGASAMQMRAGVSSVLVYVVQGIIIFAVAIQAARKYSQRLAIQTHAAEEV